LSRALCVNSRPHAPGVPESIDGMALLRMQALIRVGVLLE
jgi:hypothetical protein